MKRATARQIDKLNRIRLETDISYEELADEIGLPMRTVYRLLTDRQQRRCFDRTHFKIVEFLKRFPPKRRRRRAQPTAPVAPPSVTNSN